MTDDRRPNLTTADRNAWRSGPEGLYSNGAVVSFQRYRRPPENMVRLAPASCGVLPVVREASGFGFLLAVPDDEAFWIGPVIEAGGDGELAIAVELVDGAVVVVGRYRRSGAFAIPGVPRPDGLFDACCRATISEVRLRSAAGIARIGLADVREFVARTGHDPPARLDAGAAYGDWRLP
jgi:hypothetical protein